MSNEIQSPGSGHASPQEATRDAVRVLPETSGQTPASAEAQTPAQTPARAEKATRTPAESQTLAERVARELFANDKTSQSLGIRIIEVRPGHARLSMSVRSDMVNGHRICHGGMVFTLADSAFAFACNSYNESTVAAAASIDFLAASYEGDELTAVATELWRTRRNGIYEITVTNQKGAKIAFFRGRSYRIDGPVVSAD